jgi:hypothetical protein
MRQASTYTFTVYNRIGLMLLREDRTYTGDIWQRQAYVSRRSYQLVRKFRDEEWVEIECKRTDDDGDDDLT